MSQKKLEIKLIKNLLKIAMSNFIRHIIVQLHPKIFNKFIYSLNLWAKIYCIAFKFINCNNIYKNINNIHNYLVDLYNNDNTKELLLKYGNNFNNIFNHFGLLQKY